MASYQNNPSNCFRNEITFELQLFRNFSIYTNTIYEFHHYNNSAPRSAYRIPLSSHAIESLLSVPPSNLNPHCSKASPIRGFIPDKKKPIYYTKPQCFKKKFFIHIEALLESTHTIFLLLLLNLDPIR